MTGSSFRGPPDENVACVRIEGGGAEGLGGASEVVAYLPRGRRGTGRRERWFVVVLDDARAEVFASALSDLLWHAREDGARSRVETLRKTVESIDKRLGWAPCPECGGVGGACHAPGPAFPVERPTGGPSRRATDPAHVEPVGLSTGERVWAIDRNHVDPAKRRARPGTIEALRSWHGGTSILVRWDDGDACEFAREEYREDGTGNLCPIRYGSESQPALRPPPRPPCPPTPPPYCGACNAEHVGPCRRRPGLLARLFGRRA